MILFWKNTMPGKQLIAAIFVGALVSLTNAAMADTVSIAQRLNSDAIIPQRGMTMDMVENRFGTPESRRLPVGEPPITRWIYAGFRVYFEHQYVIHSVAD